MANQFGWVCHIESDRRYGYDRFRLVVMKRNYDSHSTDVLMSDGTWETVPEMEMFPETPERTVGLTFPADTINAFVDAVKEFKGDSLDTATEVKVLKEWLTIERTRVENLIQQTIKLMT